MGRLLKTNCLQPGQGRSIWVTGDLYTLKTTGAETGGAFAMIEAVVPPGGGPPPHRHTREDEAFYVLEGELVFHADGQSFTAGPGSWITLARGSVHRFRNESRATARMLICVTPAGLDDFFLEIGRPAVEGEEGPFPTTPEEIRKLLATAPKYGLEIHAPDH
ncbi:MAG: cupin [Planctomycetes bacterium SCN 63-9]|nr:MAG: cupin [Planctomycetes bacterium SCN 63-9]